MQDGESSNGLRTRSCSLDFDIYESKNLQPSSVQLEEEKIRSVVYYMFHRRKMFGSLVVIECREESSFVQKLFQKLSYKVTKSIVLDAM